MSKTPKYLQDLQDAGMDQQTFETGSRFFMARGVSVGPKRDRAGRYRGEFTWLAIHPTEARAIICTCGPGALVDMFDAPSDTLRQFGRTV